MWRAAERLGIDPGAAAAAVDAGVLDLGAQVRFNHPCMRSATYRSASPDERRALHAALADVTDAQLDPDRRAWHRAQATPGPDEQVAEELERSAGRALARGGVAAAAAFLETAATLTPDPARRAGRLLAAAQAKRNAGALDEALLLLAAVDGDAAEIERLRGEIAFDQRRVVEATQLLISAARRLEPSTQSWRAPPTEGARRGDVGGSGCRRRPRRHARPRAGPIHRGPRTSCWTRSRRA